MRRYQCKSGGQVLKTSSTDMVDHVRFAIATARAGTRCWIKSKDPDDDLARFYSAEFAMVDGQLRVSFYEWQYLISPYGPMAPTWITQLAHAVSNLTEGVTTT